MAQDPGFSFLYRQQSGQHQHQHQQQPQQQQQRRPWSEAGDAAGAPALTMSHLPRDPTAKLTSATDWGAALGNLENAKMAIDALQGLINDAVFLDEEAFTNASTLQLYQLRIQAQQRRLRDAEHEMDALRAETAAKDEAIQQQKQRAREAEQRASELQQELENNEVVFKTHYQELLLRNDEIARLKAVIEGMQTG